jgi:hypothetical protein
LTTILRSNKHSVLSRSIKKIFQRPRRKRRNRRRRRNLNPKKMNSRHDCPLLEQAPNLLNNQSLLKRTKLRMTLKTY